MIDDKSDDEKEIEKPLVAKSAADLQRLKLMKLMKNPEKAVIIPERPKVKGTPAVPEFVRNVMGSSAGAGSGEFHVYRHLRRKEYARQKFIQEKGHKELLDEAYHKKLEENKKIAEELTAKKRAKRLKKKRKCKHKKFKVDENVKEDSTENDSSDEGKHSESENTIDSNKKNDSKNNSSITNLDIDQNSKTLYQETSDDLQIHEEMENLKNKISKKNKSLDKNVEEKNQIIQEVVKIDETMKNNESVHIIDETIDKKLSDNYKKKESVDVS